ncbi:MAG: hypothetical protein MNSN_09250 [Minisyncoccus archaeiphilus]|uniref:hypothetical protein n=1 Tax=Minisyncoccus archaeiphilus TaxID=3238481 RepID=UPI002B134E43|nr:MAG: hypothetical protein MNSN_09250 [Candidatus Parcubacteria bacterium]
MMFNLSTFAKSFPTEYREMMVRDQDKVSLNRYKNKLVISGIGRAPRPYNTSCETVFHILLEIFPRVEKENRFESEQARKEFYKVKRIYEQEISCLIGRWDDEVLLTLAMSVEEDTERTFNYLKRIRMTNIASYI